MSGRQTSQTANFPGRQLSLQPNVQERNVLGANCPERQLSGRQMSKAPNVGRQMSGRGLSPFQYRHNCKHPSWMSDFSALKTIEWKCFEK